MSRIGIASAVLCGLALADLPPAASQPFPSGGSPNPAMTGAPAARPVPPPPPPAAPAAPPGPAPSATDAAGSSGLPRAVAVARATVIPRCTGFIDSSATAGGGTARSPHKTIAQAVTAATAGAVICVAEGTYAEQIRPGEKYFTLAGGFPIAPRKEQHCG